MEVRNKYHLLNSTWTPQGRFKLEWSQGFKDTMQIQNRVKILEMEKHRKVKDIQKKLHNHKKNVELKIHKYNRHQDIQKMHENQQTDISMSYNHFQADKKRRQDNIRTVRAQLVKSKTRQFQQHKKLSEEIEKKIIQQKNSEIYLKTQKRNRVRLMQIQAKQNITSSWNNKLKQMKQNRQKQLEKKVKQHENNLMSISKMQKKQKKILEEIFGTQKMEQQLDGMIQEESKMGGIQLSKIYKNT